MSGILNTTQLQADTWKSKDDSREFYKCYAWVNFNGTGTVAIRASGNVSSITDNNTGDYTVNFTTAMPDENYAVCISAGGGGNIDREELGTLTSSSVRMTFTDSGVAQRDPTNVCVTTFR